jgi:hypothetical protein
MMQIIAERDGWRLYRRDPQWVQLHGGPLALWTPFKLAMPKRSASNGPWRYWRLWWDGKRLISDDGFAERFPAMHAWAAGYCRFER